jgi:hypothetical protein
MTRYATPAAFRRALTDRLRALSDHSKWTLPQLRRQFAYDRLLERLYMMDDGWIVKGAVALLARDIGVRGSLDIDVYRAKAADGAEADLREAASRGIDDWFRFEIGPRRAVGDESSAVRLPVVAYIGQQEWERFQIDLVGSDLRMTGEPDDVPAIARIDIPELQQNGYRAYPLVDTTAVDALSRPRRLARDRDRSVSRCRAAATVPAVGGRATGRRAPTDVRGA